MRPEVSVVQKRHQKTNVTYQVKSDSAPNSSSEVITEYTLYHTAAADAAAKPYTAVVKVNQVDLTMEIDTGVSFSIISK